MVRFWIESGGRANGISVGIGPGPCVRASGVPDRCGWGGCHGGPDQVGRAAYEIFRQHLMSIKLQPLELVSEKGAQHGWAERGRPVEVSTTDRGGSLPCPGVRRSPSSGITVRVLPEPVLLGERMGDGDGGGMKAQTGLRSSYSDSTRESRLRVFRSSGFSRKI